MMDNLLQTVPFLWCLYRTAGCFKFIVFYLKIPIENIWASLLHLSALTQLQEDSYFVTQEKCLNYRSALGVVDPASK